MVLMGDSRPLLSVPAPAWGDLFFDAGGAEAAFLAPGDELPGVPTFEYELRRRGQFIAGASTGKRTGSVQQSRYLGEDLDQLARRDFVGQTQVVVCFEVPDDLVGVQSTAVPAEHLSDGPLDHVTSH